MSSLKEDIKSRQFKKCYLLFGEDQFLMQKAQKELENAVVDEMAAVMNKDFFDGAADIGKVMDASETMPFLSDMRLVVVKDSGLFDDGRSKDTEKMAEYIANIPKFNRFKTHGLQLVKYNLFLIHNINLLCCL